MLKKTTESSSMVSYLDTSITISENKFVTTIYNKRDDFNFHIVNFPYLDSNIPTRPAYGIYISQLIRITRICVKYSSFAERNRHITSRLVKQGFHYLSYVIPLRSLVERMNTFLLNTE